MVGRVIISYMVMIVIMITLLLIMLMVLAKELLQQITLKIGGFYLGGKINLTKDIILQQMNK